MTRDMTRNMTHERKKQDLLPLDAYELAEIRWISHALSLSSHARAVDTAIGLTDRCLEYYSRGYPVGILRETFDHATLRDVATPKDIQREIRARLPDDRRYGVAWQPTPEATVALHRIRARAGLASDEDAIRFSLRYCEMAGRRLLSGPGRTSLSFARDLDAGGYGLTSPFDRSLSGMFARSARYIGGFFHQEKPQAFIIAPPPPAPAPQPQP